MTRNRRKKILAIIGFLAICALITWVLLSGRQPPVKKPEKDPPSRSEGGVTTHGGRTVISLTPEAQRRSGIALARLRAVSRRQERRAYGTVSDLQSLVSLRRSLIDSRRNLADLRNGLTAAEARVEKTRAKLEVSSRQYERLKALYEDDRNVSEKSLQAGEGVWHSDRADVRAARAARRAAEEGVQAAEEALQALKDAARQQWGDTLADWIWENPPGFGRLVRREDVLLQITLPPGSSMEPAEIGWVQTPAGIRARSHFLSPSPRTDPRIQGMSFFYLAPAETGMLSGMNVVAYLPAGPEVSGVVIPDSAVVWRQGKAWVYLRTNADHFERREISTENPVPEGYFVRKGFQSGNQVVVRGAQVLLSIEYFPRTQGGGEGQD
jgi:hypothetical protein